MNLQNALADFFVAPWISWRNYRSKVDGENRSIISNEKSHEYFLLEGYSSKIWQGLSEGNKTILQIDLDTDETSTFIHSLLEAGLLFYRGVAASSMSTGSEGEGPRIDWGSDDESSQFEQEIMNWTWQNGFLFSAHLELTYLCNQFCIHCYNPGAVLHPDDPPRRKHRELNTSEWKMVIDQLAEIGVFRLNFSGGEPTLRKDFFELFSYARKLGFAVVVLTNGINSTPSFIEELARLWPHSVEVSIYSADPKLHDRITGISGSFHRSVDCLRKMKAAGLRTTMKTTLMEATVSGYADCRALAESLDASLVMDVGISPNVDGRLLPIGLNPDFDTLVQVAMEPDGPTSVNESRIPNWREKMAFVCGAGRNTLSINPLGEITPCAAMPWVIGSTHNTSLTDIWHTAISHRGDPKVCSTAKVSIVKDDARRLGDWQAIKLRDFDECGMYEWCSLCQEICPGDALVISGTPFAPVEYRCKAALARMAAMQMNSGPLL